MKKRIGREEISNTFKTTLSNNKLISDEDTAVIFYDLDYLESRVRIVKEIFPRNTIHAIAAKANPLIEILHLLKGLDVGIEAASFPELYIAEKIGFSSRNIVFDSPSKTQEELKYALKLGVHINADSFMEIDRISDILKKTNSNSNIGVRINPQVGAGSIKTTSVADKISKFGIPINERRLEIIKTYINHKFLNGIHLHIGSQGISIDQLILGLKKVFELVKEINYKLQIQGRRIEYFDIGGGFPVSYRFDDEIPDILIYYNQAKENFPKLFSEEFTLLTEFGRFIHANTAWAVSRVEYVKNESSYKILSIHLGADFLLRKAYHPNDWHHEITVLDSFGNIKLGLDKKKYIIAGPLCFAGDILAKDIELPEVTIGDYIIIHDVGAYTLSMWSRYNSRQIPKVLGYNNDDIKIIKKRETLNDLYSFWK